MSLETYKHKRDFRKTPEPSGAPTARPRAKAALSYVIQKHAARRLHYDFRLELDGVLKSWAVPKGPSLDPHEKRLAVEVEDHPLDYGGFEGVIPQGEYGGGTVLLWDRGTWEPLEPDPAKSLDKGMLKFALHGDKLHGHWMLVRLKRRPRDKTDNWLLIKERDEAAIPGSGSAVVDELTESVASHRTIDVIAADRYRVWHSKGAETPGEETRQAAPGKKETAPGVAHRRRAQGGDARHHQAAARDRRRDGARWRRLAARDQIRRLPPDRAARQWRRSAYHPQRARLDRQIPGIGGAAGRGAGQIGDHRWRAGGAAAGRHDQLRRSAGRDLGRADRPAHLFRLRPALSRRLGPDRRDAGGAQGGACRTRPAPGRWHAALQRPPCRPRAERFLKQAASYGVEGIVAKHRDKPYEPDRGRSWLKIKARNRDEFVVVGFTDPEGSRERFGALLLGYHDPQGALRYAGRVGSGFGAAQLMSLHERLGELAVRKAPVALPPGERRKDIHWTRPELVAEVEYASWTADKLIRQSTFQGLREDKPASEIVYDPASLPTAGGSAIGSARRRPAAAAHPAEKLRDGSILVEGVRLSHPERALYADTGLTKQAVAQYYVDVARWALPHLAGRPLTIIRSTGGKGQRAFYQKHVSAGMPQEIKGLKVAGEEEPFPIIEDVAGLIALVQVGAVEIHPWGSSIKDVERPDRVTFDLDPDEGLAWERVTEAAIDVRDALDAIGLASFVKTTGGKGLHVVVPLQPKLDWDAVKNFSKWVADRLAEERPTEFTANQIKRQRRDRIYLDYLRNSRGATAVGAYSPRERTGTTVSTPLSWDEVEAGVRPADFTVATVPARLAALAADPWAEIGTLRQSISAKVRKHIGI